MRNVVQAKPEGMCETPANRVWLAKGSGFRLAAKGPHRSGEGNNYLDNVHLHSLIEETYHAVTTGDAVPNRSRDEPHLYPQLVPAWVRNRGPAAPHMRILYEGDDRVKMAAEQTHEKAVLQRLWYLAAGFVSDQELRAACAGLTLTGEHHKMLAPADFCSTVVGLRVDGKILTGPFWILFGIFYPYITPI